MPFDPSTAQLADSNSFDPSTAQEFDSSSAKPVEEDPATTYWNEFDKAQPNVFPEGSPQRVARDRALGQAFEVGSAAATPDFTPIPSDQPTSFLDKIKQALQEEEANVKQHIKNRDNLVLDNFKHAATRIALPAIDATTTFAGMLAGYQVYNTMTQSGANPDLAVHTLDSFKEWSSVRNLMDFYGKKFGMSQDQIDQTVHDPNFIDSMFEHVGEMNKDILSGVGAPTTERAQDVVGLIEAAMFMRAGGMKFGKVEPADTNVAKAARTLAENRKMADYAANEIPRFEDEGGAQQFDPSTAQMVADKLPEISPEFQVQKPLEEGQAASAFDAESARPLDQYVYDLNKQYPNIEGQGPDVDTSNIQSPYMSAKDVEIANNEGNAGAQQLTLTPDILNAEIKNNVEPTDVSSLKPNEVQYLRNFGAVNKDDLYISPSGVRIPLGQIKKSQGGWVKLPGGNWNPQVVSRIYQDLLTRPMTMGRDLPIYQDWALKTVKNYVNKYLGTERDPLKDVRITDTSDLHAAPDETFRWEDLTDSLVNAQEAKYYAKQYGHLDDLSAQNALRKEYEPLRDLARIGKQKPTEPVYNLSGGPRNTGLMAPEILGIRKAAMPPSVAQRIFEDFIQHASDYLSNHVPIEQLSRYDFPRLVREVVAQDERQRKAMEKASLENASKGTTPYKEYPDGMKWVEVGKGGTEEENVSALAHEGNTMGHCVGGYCELVNNGTSRIFSLRDKQNRSHVTVEVNPESNEILQVKGKQNAAPVDKYIPYVQDFVNKEKFSSFYASDRDLRGAGLYPVSVPGIGTLYPEKAIDERLTHISPESLTTKLGGHGHYTEEQIMQALRELAKPSIKHLRTFGAMSPEEAENFSRGIPRIFSSTGEAIKRKIDQIVSPYEPDQLDKLVLEKKDTEKDISATQNAEIHVVTKNVAKNIVDSPSLTWLITSIRKAHAMVSGIANDLGIIHDPINKLPKAQLSRVLATAVELQKSKWQEYGQMQGLKEFSDTDYINAGGRQEDLPVYRQIRTINNKALEILSAARKQLDGSDFQSPVIGYHPKSYGSGNHALVVYDKSTGDIAFYHRYKQYAEMATDWNDMKKSLAENGADAKFAVDYRDARKDWENPFADMTAANIPQAIQKILAGIEEKIETRKRTFEMKRAVGDIEGLTQFLKDQETPDPELINQWNKYLQNVINFKKNVELFKLQRQIIDNGSYYKDKPNTYDFMVHTLQDELGANVGWKPMRTLAKGVSDQLNELAKLKLKAKGIKLLGEDDFVISPDTARYATKLASSAASSVTLLFNVSNGITNALQMPLTGVVGLPLDILGRLKADPAKALYWTIRVNGDFMESMTQLAYTKATGKPTVASQILDKYNKMGLVQAHMFDEIQEITQMRPGSIIAKALNTGKKYTNDMFIETPTNATALLYYDHLINRYAKDHLLKAGVDEAQLQPLIVDLAKSWTGDYSRWAKPAIYRKMGIVGDTLSNFTNWSQNQMGRMFEAIKEIKPEQGKGLAQGLGYMLAFWYLYAQTAGGKNSPIFATIDTIRRYLNSIKDREDETIPDMNYYAKEYGIPNWAFPQHTWLDSAQEALGIQNPIDVSSSQQYQGSVAMNTVQYGILASFVRWAALGAKTLYSKSPWAQDTKNPTPIGVRGTDMMAAAQGLPSLARAAINQKYGTEPRPDGTTMVESRFGTPNYRQINPTEKLYNSLGLKSTRQREEQQKIQDDRIYVQNLAKVPALLRSYIKDQADQYAKTGDSTLKAQVLTNIMKLEQVDPKQFDVLQKELTTMIQNDRIKRMALPEEQAKQEFLKANPTSPDYQSRMQQLQKRVERLKNY